MPPSPSTCVTCGKPFAANRDLATIPDASKIAFDPARRRAWRICTSCDEWNLLGPDASLAALPEIEARFATLIPATTPEFSLAPARVSPQLELLRIGPPGRTSPAELAAHRLKEEAELRARRLRWMPLLWLFLVAVMGVAYWPVAGHPGAIALMVLVYSQVKFFTALSKKLFGERTSRLTLPLSTLLMLASALFLYLDSGWETLRYCGVGLLIMLPFYFIIDPLIRRHVGVLRVKLESGRRVRISERAAPEVTISWTPGGSDVTLHDLPDGRPLSGPDVAKVYRFLYASVSKEGMLKAMLRLDATTKEAYGLLRSLGGLPGLLEALEGFRRDRDGRVPLAELPVLYLVALDLALAAEFSGSDSHDQLRHRALAASEVAEEAEALDP
ncbi:MAG: hypothetical protein ABIZ70_07275 [Gemmatimonadales bacterium]